MSTCTHFRGILADHPCTQGIALASFGWELGGDRGLPCMESDTRPKNHCDQFAAPTPEEARTKDQHTRDLMLAWIAQAVERTTRGECLSCGHPMEARAQVGRSIYALPCWCRLGQGTLRDAAGHPVKRVVVTGPP